MKTPLPPFRHGGPAAVLVFATLFALAGPAHAAWEPVPPAAWQEPARPDSGGADAIVLLERSECRQTEDRFEVDYFERARVFTPEGRSIGDVDVEYVKGDWKLTNLRARSVNPQGGIAELDLATVVTTTQWKYRDFEVLKASLVIPGIEPGSIVEWGYTLSGPRGYGAGWRFRFSNDFYTCLSTHTWKVPAGTWSGYRPERRYGGITAGHVEEVRTPSPERPTSVTFTVRSLGGARGEALAPPRADAGPHVDVFVLREGAEPTLYWSTWKLFMDSYQERFGKDAGKLDQLVNGFREGPGGDLGALERAFHWMQANYTSIDDLPWARRPDADRIAKSYRYSESMKQLLERREATEYEINVLMTAIARGLGFQASLGDVGDRRFQSFDSRSMGFPPENFVTVVWSGRDLYFLQPASRQAVFGSIPWYLRGGDCLLSGDSRDLFVRVPSDVGAVARSSWRVSVEVEPSGAVSGKVAGRLEQEACAAWRRVLWDADPARWTAEAAEQIGGAGGPEVTIESLSTPGPGDTLLTVEGRAQWPEVANVLGDVIEVPVCALATWRLHPQFLLEHRSQSVLFRDPIDETLDIALRVPAGTTVRRLPAASGRENRLGRWSVQWSYEDGVLHCLRRLVVLRAEVPIRDYGLVRELFDPLEQADRATVLVEKAP